MDKVLKFFKKEGPKSDDETYLAEEQLIRNKTR